MSYVKSGKHIGAMRAWVQRNIPRGDQLTWSSKEKLSLTLGQLEEIAQKVRDVVLPEEDKLNERIEREFKEKIKLGLQRDSARQKVKELEEGLALLSLRNQQLEDKLQRVQQVNEEADRQDFLKEVSDQVDKIIKE